ncbi:PhzF family phenazine biosynthesis protein [Sinobaca sp. H24]|uniref:PhzF family phenazine biosynthesis protein n=1 Tax=Sinobaca sp. H24 TaxID=2923376 RepID=UPI0020799C7B|nr:PhzF family phenazine biosynthesis protein [Sinobaca sp. H24]
MKIYTVDAFTNEPFAGNPAAVCLLEKPAEDMWMQKTAMEMNLSETAFLVKESEPFHYQLRWFTPSSEVDLCGHATLASAHILWEQDSVPFDQVLYFHTKSGLLSASYDQGRIILDFPVEMPGECSIPDVLLDSLSVPVVSIEKNRLEYIVETTDEEAVFQAKPDTRRFLELDARGVILTAGSSQEKYDFVSRCFYPALGVEEDPVTGSAHCGLAPFWEKRLHKSSFSARQASSRGGDLFITIEKDRCLIAGSAVTVLESTLFF